jgi:hypothetical protein
MTAGGSIEGPIWPLLPLCEPAWDPLFWPVELPSVESAWWGHVPFAHWLTAAVRPRLIVELGTHHGVSYAAFCQAVQRVGLPTRCVAIDTWEGDPHAGTYEEEVFREFDAFNRAHFGAFSTLLRCKFDDALAGFADGSIDLLHIDGFHTYDAVRHDFETWASKLSERAIVLFHDIEVRRDGFGVWRLWDELRECHQNFEFLHGHGLGVLAVGPGVPASIKQLCDLPEPMRARLRERAATLGARWIAEMQLVQAARAMRESEAAGARLEAESGRLQAELHAAVRRIDLLGQTLDSTQKELARCRIELTAGAASLAEAQARLAILETEAAAISARLVAAEADRAALERAGHGSEEARREAEGMASALRAELDGILSSTAWRAMAPLRALSAKLPRGLREAIRRRAGSSLSHLGAGGGPSMGLPEPAVLRIGRIRSADVNAIATSALFDAGWYARHCPDVAQSGLDMAEHYLTVGATEGRDPGPSFDSDWYVAQYPDVAASGMNPLLHYIRHGAQEHRLRSAPEAKAAIP